MVLLKSKSYKNECIELVDYIGTFMRGNVFLLEVKIRDKSETIKMILVYTLYYVINHFIIGPLPPIIMSLAHPGSPLSL